MTQQVIDLDTIFGGSSELLVVCYGKAEYNSEEIDGLEFIVAIEHLIFCGGRHQELHVLSFHYRGNNIVVIFVFVNNP
jgi:hypothetical protein